MSSLLNQNSTSLTIWFFESSWNIFTVATPTGCCPSPRSATKTKVLLKDFPSKKIRHGILYEHVKLFWNMFGIRSANCTTWQKCQYPGILWRLSTLWMLVFVVAVASGMKWFPEILIHVSTPPRGKYMFLPPQKKNNSTPTPPTQSVRTVEQSKVQVLLLIWMQFQLQGSQLWSPFGITQLIHGT